MSFIPYGRQFIDGADVQAVVDVLKGDWLTQGPAVEAFEKAFAAKVGVKHAVAFCNGTAALHGAYYAAGVGPGDRVVTSPLTFAATANAARYLGADVRFVDVDPTTLCLDPSKLDPLASEGLKVIAPVSYGGYPAPLDQIIPFARSLNAVVVEDACHALGAGRNGRMVGAEADMTVFSFHPVKHITTAEGGMVTTDDDEFARRLRLFRSHGIERDPSRMSRCDGPWYYEMVDLGYNYRLSDIHSALGLSQLSKLDGFVEARRRIAERYDRLLSGIHLVELPPSHSGHSYHLYPIQVPEELRFSLFNLLRDSGVGVQVHYLPVHMHPYYRNLYGFDPEDFPNALDFYRRAISLPMFPSLEEEQQERVVKVIREFMTRRA
ncbi:UDP-4-keto-6-deoxy-N-acetylglucosamine 4-aminotransferase [Thermanaerovibrio velox DSM 12556]|uniref:UDP-4-keto-6-deoxy-N-acetylglucosamine 4-aminotransferase n=1 Tax=Thermanaerovibrio velox DSM 12556 TaxID=926567 RepID=H0USF2_9BACT|nr:UDP-4-amino-4,6-dideoxy-N-acetyl-beta-L-altrosamine transaminase [Thermanaerovibrio velox]EHM10241.1 UDP-4-keto-6-deoxy-N-acetylglucosamine 4-aminotransferase [Thermanaerovibrio velox DSM 12556]